MFRSVKAPPNGTVDIDFKSFPSGDDATAYFTISLEAYYNTGEVRSVNADATWTSTSSYVTPYVIPINMTMPKSDAIIQVQLNSGVAKQTTAVFNVKHGSFSTAARFIDVP